MIRISLALLCTLLLPGALFAERVPVEKARRLAAGMFRPAASAASLAAKGSDLQLVWDGETAATRSGSDPAFYVFNSTGGGFAIIAGDDAARPVLGYSPTGRFEAENMPENIRKWFSGIRGQILAAREAGLTPAPEAWNAVSASTVGKVVRSLETAQWNQDAPYNNLCPVMGGERAYTGCVATAAAIVMRYHRWPASGTGTLPSYTYTVPSTGAQKTVQGHALGHAYSWDDMPLTYTDAATAKQKTAVAQLMYDLGVMSEAMYDTGEGTGIYTDDLVRGLLTHMRYDKSAVLRYRDWSGLEDWDALIRSDIDNYGPVLYAGASEDVGHQFVIDGYTDTDYFCVNWGWGGYCNGQYLLSALDPDERGIGGGSASSGGFVFDQSALLGLRKDTSGNSEWASQLVIGASDDSQGLKASVSDFRTGSSFTMEVMYLFNIGLSAFDGVYELAVCDSRGQYKESISTSGKFQIEAPDTHIHGAGDDNIPCKITQEIRPGDRIRVRYRANWESTWKWASAYDEQSVAEIILAEEVDPEAIDANTSLHFDRASRRMTLSTLAGVSYRLLSTADGAAVAEGDSGSSGKITIDASRLQGSYLLHLEREGAADMRLSLKF